MARDEVISVTPAVCLREQRTVIVEGLGVLTVRLRDRLIWLYEALVLLCGLTEACKRLQNGQYRQIAETSEPGGSSRTTLEFFVNKLAQVGDNRPFGDTITALAIIQKPDKMQYIFASNQRNSEDAGSVVRIIQQLLDRMGLQTRVDVRDDDKSPLFRELLRSILLFHTQRITLYKSRLQKRLDQCIEDLKTKSFEAGIFPTNQVEGVYGTHSPGDPLLDELEYLKTLTRAGEPSNDNEDFARNSEYLILAANGFLKSPMYESVIERAREGRFDESERWCELQHFIGRLSSYHVAVRAIISSRRRLHPDLFENFEILWLPSSSPMNNPMNMLQSHMAVKTQQKRRSAESIIRRMMSNTADRNVTLEQANTLQVCDLDKCISNQCQRKSFHPIVHCEILLLHYLCRECCGDRHHIPFFDDARYIGCSKPTCRLCEYYFAAHNSDIRVRSGHKNVYSNWTVPNLFVDNSIEAKERDNLLDRVISKIREDALRALRDKTSDGKRHDSNTHSSHPTFRSTEANDQTNMGGLALALADLSLGGAANAFQLASRDKQSIFAEAVGDEADEEDVWECSDIDLAEHSGGVSL
ncbi:hypothetical protein BDP55DRAFT_631065 [Colletotrichum godetiae]|uniref:Uncharacterized protein n=1 Tax=Colletotrichum godetiae TaxID=1209918 RepID=A0AAJ0AM51_9PEZI|nr:uncharacterized protein BDP55DRAFT_631065 [Colletotrichum godetiae]KAK1676422.1 hypothetical protein BDP55DRAFT_631065 [Colletotrichum godetiae]